MKIGETLRVENREDWRRWLKNNYRRKKEIWLVVPRKSTGERKISYNDSVEEALCFGWIDSIQKTLDKDHTVQRFSQRKPKTPYSQTNIERLRELVKKDRVIGPVLKSLGGLLEQEFAYPEDIIRKIKANKKAYGNFMKFSGPYKRIRIAFIEAARNRPEEFKKRLENFIKKSEKNKTYGYGGVEKYF